MFKGAVIDENTDGKGYVIIALPSPGYLQSIPTGNNCDIYEIDPVFGTNDQRTILDIEHGGVGDDHASLVFSKSLYFNKNAAIGTTAVDETGPRNLHVCLASCSSHKYSSRRV